MNETSFPRLAGDELLRDVLFARVKHVVAAANMFSERVNSQPQNFFFLRRFKAKAPAPYWAYDYHEHEYQPDVKAHISQFLHVHYRVLLQYSKPGRKFFVVTDFSEHTVLGLMEKTVDAEGDECMQNAAYLIANATQRNQLRITARECGVLMPSAGLTFYNELDEPVTVEGDVPPVFPG